MSPRDDVRQLLHVIDALVEVRRAIVDGRSSLAQAVGGLSEEVRWRVRGRGALV